MRTRWSRFLGLLAGVSLILACLWVFRALWFPWLARILPIFGSVEMQAVGEIRDWLALLVPLVMWLASWILRRPSSKRSKLLLESSVEQELRAKCTDRGRRAWIPRTPGRSRFVETRSSFVFAGPSGAGKTREALELVRLAIAHSSIRGTLVKPSPEVHFASCSRTDLEQAVRDLHSTGQAVVLWLDDLHTRLRDDKCAERLSDLIELLKKREEHDSRSKLHVVGTLRPEFATESQSRWLNDRGIKQIPLAALETEDLSRLVDGIAAECDLELAPETRKVILDSPDQRPALLEAALTRLTEEGYDAPSSEQANKMREFLGLGLAGLWRQDRDELVHSAGSAAQLLWALEVLHATGQRMRVELAKALARRQPGLGWHRLGIGLRQGRRVLANHRYFQIMDGYWVAQDAALEWQVKEPDALEQLRHFVCHLRRPLHRRGLRWLNGLRDAQKWLALGLGNRYVARGTLKDLEAAIQLYKRAYAIGSNFHEALNNWGNALDSKAALLAGLERTYEALAACREAEGRYAQAVQIKPDKHEALYNWGIALADKAWLLACVDRTDEALAAYGEAENRYAQAVQIKPDRHEALYNWIVALTNKAPLLDQLGRQDEAKAAREEAQRLLSRLEELKPPEDASSER